MPAWTVIVLHLILLWVIGSAWTEIINLIQNEHEVLIFLAGTLITSITFSIMVGIIVVMSVALTDDEEW